LVNLSIFLNGISSELEHFAAILVYRKVRKAASFTRAYNTRDELREVVKD